MLELARVGLVWFGRASRRRGGLAGPQVPSDWGGPRRATGPGRRTSTRDGCRGLGGTCAARVLQCAPPGRPCYLCTGGPGGRSLLVARGTYRACLCVRAQFYAAACFVLALSRSCGRRARAYAADPAAPQRDGDGDGDGGGGGGCGCAGRSSDHACASVCVWAAPEGRSVSVPPPRGRPGCVSIRACVCLRRLGWAGLGWRGRPGPLEGMGRGVGGADDDDGGGGSGRTCATHAEGRAGGAWGMRRACRHGLLRSLVRLQVRALRHGAARDAAAHTRTPTPQPTNGGAAFAPARRRLPRLPPGHTWSSLMTQLATRLHQSMPCTGARAQSPPPPSASLGSAEKRATTIPAAAGPGDHSRHLADSGMLNGLRHGEAASYGQQRPPQRTDRPSALIDGCWLGAPDCRDLSTVVGDHGDRQLGRAGSCAMRRAVGHAVRRAARRTPWHGGPWPGPGPSRCARYDGMAPETLCMSRRPVRTQDADRAERNVRQERQLP